MINQLVSPAKKSFVAVVEQAPGSFLCTAQSSDGDHLLIDSSVGTSSVSIKRYVCSMGSYAERFSFDWFSLLLVVDQVWFTPGNQNITAGKLRGAGLGDSDTK